MKKEKRAEVTMSWLVIIILTILGFVILILFYLFFPWKGDITQETCHQSIIFRATMPFGEAYVPLKCPTEKICIVAHSSAECADMATEKNVKKEKVKSREDIEKIIAESMVDCWRMTGEGKLGIFPKGFLDSLGAGQIESSCLICSRIGINLADIEEAGIDIEQVNVDYYMEHKNIPGEDLTYSDYFSSRGNTKISVSDSAKFKIVDPETEQTIVEGQVERISEIQETTNNEDIAVLFMQIPTIGKSEAFFNALAALGVTVGATYTLPPLKWTVGRVLTGAVKLLTWKVAGAIFVVVGGGATIIQQRNVVAQRTRVAAHCEDVLSGGKEKEGCSVLRVIDYEPDDINKFCDTIESIP